MSSLADIKARLAVKPQVALLERKPVGIVAELFTPQQEEEEKKDKKGLKLEVQEELDHDFNRSDLMDRLGKAKKQPGNLQKPNEIMMAKSQAISLAKSQAPPVIVEKRPTKLIIQEDSDSEQQEEELEMLRKEADADQEEPIEDKTIPEPIVSLKKPPMVQKGLLDKTAWVEIGDTIIGDTKIKDRLPKEEPNVLIKAPDYFMNNRELFVEFINHLFAPYKEEIESEESAITCDSIGTTAGNVSLMTHQKIIRDYLNLYTPYRGLLLYHGLGSGKTCSSIAIAEGMSTNKRIIVLTPASLRANYYAELKKCGDALYKKNQFWEFVKVSNDAPMIDTLATALHLPRETIKKRKGAWVVNVKKPANYASLSTNDKKSLEIQLDEMIQTKYTFLNYNGIRREKLSVLTDKFTKNLFHDSVVIIDEAHNFISRIVNKIGKEKPPTLDRRGEQEHVHKSLSMILYEQLMRATGCRVVLLTGTPVINKANEVGILFNILRGYIKTWEIIVEAPPRMKLSKESVQDMFEKLGYTDTIDYSSALKKIYITRNPFGFVKETSKNKQGYQGVHKDTRNPDVDDAEFERRINKVIRDQEIEIIKTDIKMYKALPDTQEEFETRFLDKASNRLKNVNALKRRILGLTSYFRSAQEELLPRFEKTPEYFHVVHVPMTDHQFKVYEAARVEERKMEKDAAKKRKTKGTTGTPGEKEPTSTYRIFSRLFCNFVMPTEKKRPLPREQEELSPDLLEKADKEGEKVDLTNEEEGDVEADQVLGKLADATYDQRIREALLFLQENGSTFLTPEALAGSYSPKFAAVLERLQDPENRGLHLIYSQFRTMEGVGIFKLVLEANGFVELKVRKTAAGVWELNMLEGDLGKPAFALYTGTESVEEREIVRNIYNSSWDLLPTQIGQALKKVHENNNLGELCKILMITSSGSEGINLRNTRYVHIMESYWHPVRMEQVIGRAIRICSHKDLPPELQSVEVFLYLMAFTEKQKTGDDSIELKKFDLSKRLPQVPLTSDEALYETSVLKEELASQLTRAIKESAVDCLLYSKKSKEGLQCVSFGKTGNPNKMTYVPDIEAQQDDMTEQLNKKRIEWRAKEVTIEGIKYAGRQVTPTLFEIYDLASYEKATLEGGEPRIVGTLELRKDGSKVFLRKT